jgi:hypothetical protein
MKDENFNPNNETLTESEKQALQNWNARITEDGELEPVKTHIQLTKLKNVMYSAEMSNDEYHNGTREFAGIPFKLILSSGKLKACKTPIHYHRNLKKHMINSLNLNNGSAFHSMILEPHHFEYELFDDTKIVEEIKADRPEIVNVKSTKEYRNWYKQFLNENGEIRENVLKKETFTAAWNLKKKLQKDLVVTDLFTDSEREQSIFMEFENLVCKVRPDGLKIASKFDAENFKEYGVNEGDLIIISVKTTIDASPDGFIRQCRNLGYHLSEAYYYDVIERYARATGFIKHSAKVHTIFLTVEKDKDEFTGHYMLRYCSSSFLEWGRREYSKNLDVYLESEDFTEGYEIINDGSIIAELNAPGYV